MKYFLTYYIFLLCFCSSFDIVAQQTFTVSGVISDAESNETIIGATVRLKDTYIGTVTDINGFFQLRGLQNGEHILEVSHVSYEPKSVPVQVDNKNILLTETLLVPRKVTLDAVSVVELRPEKLGDREVETSLRELSIKAVQLIPAARSDVFSAIKFLPGIKGSSPFSPLVSVRGGDPNENLIMMDGIVLYNPYHVSTSAGVFNTNTIKDIELLVGGFGAEYGGRNSSIINVTTKDGNSSDFRGEFEPTTNRFKGYAEFPVNANSTMTIAGRAYYPVINNFMMYAGTYFFDLNLSYTIRLNPKNRLSFKLFSSRDITQLEFSKFYKYLANSFNDEVLKESFSNFEFINKNKWNNNAASLILRTIISPTLTLRTQVYGSFHQSKNSSLQSYYFEDPETGDLFYNDNYSTDFESYIHDLCGKMSLNWTPDRFQTIKTGIEANTYRFSNSAQMNEFSRGEESADPYLIAGFIEDKIKVGPFILRPGIRFSKYSELSHAGWEPRANAVVQLPDGFEFKASWGVYLQYLTSMNTSEYEFSQMLDYYYPFHQREPLRSVHYIAGFNTSVTETSMLTFDVFYKDMVRLYTFDLSRQETRNGSLGDRLIEGSGTAYGLELMWLGKWKSLSGWLSYTLSRSEREYPGYIGGTSFLSEYDRTHTLKGVLSYQLTERLSYSFACQFMSGHPTTVARTRQTYFYYDPATNSIIPSAQYVDEVKNNTRLPFVIQLDIGIKKRIRKGFGAKLKDFLNAEESYLTVDVQNITFLFRNIEYYMIPGFDNIYIPFGFNYLPFASAGYSIKF
jgi:hypothetical protein